MRLSAFSSIPQRIVHWYTVKNPWYVPVVAGFFYVLGSPPFNGQLHPAFVFFPVVSFLICVPLFGLAIHPSLKRSVLHTYIFGISASLGQLYWIAFVTPEGLWHLIVLGVLLLTLYEGLFFTVNGLLFRYAFKRFPRSYALIVPAWWVLVEYSKSIGEMSFPWDYLGYSMTPLLPFSQVSSMTGIYGMSFIIVVGNILVWRALRERLARGKMGKNTIALAGFAVLLCVVSFWGWCRLRAAPVAGPKAKIALVQPNIDQNHWGIGSLDTSFGAIESQVLTASRDNPDVIILPESALLCYLVKRPSLRNRVIGWSEKIKIPLILGSLDWEIAPPRGIREYLVYNAAFFLDTGSTTFQPYYKMKLVPFSEALPFQGIFPILSRVNLGQADFKRGTKQVIFRVGNTIKAAPFICFDIIYPSLVRSAARTANLLVHITNDGWFGRSSGPYQHALMSQQRCIENGISLARCANSGITMLVDQYGRIISKTRLGERTVLTGAVSLSRVPTLYSKLGDWPVALSAAIVLIQLLLAARRRFTN